MAFEGTAQAKPGNDIAATSGDGWPQLRLATKCTTLDQFVAQFHSFIDEGSAFVPGRRLAVGTSCRLLITLTDGTPVLSARCEVRDPALSPPGAPAGATRLKLLEIDPATRETHRMLLARRRQRASAPTPAKLTPKPLVPTKTMLLVSQPPAPKSDDRDRKESIRPPVVTLVRPTSKPAETTPVPAARDEAEARAPGASYKLPANPFSELSADALASFVDCTLFEERERAPTGEVAAALAAAAPEPTPSAAVDPEPRPAVVIEGSPEEPEIAAPLSRIRPLLAKWGPVIASSVISLAIGYGLRGAPAPAPAPVVVAVPAVPAPQTPPPTPAPAAPEPVATPEPVARAKGKLHITSTPPGAMVTLDGKWKIGTTPRTIDVALGGSVMLSARRRGHRPWSQAVELTKSQTDVEIRLEPAKASRPARKSRAAEVDFLDGIGAAKPAKRSR